jgi:menaquinone-dependent protoporphyrinogen IX oxidase
MNIWIVYDSKFGNNKRIANALAEQFQSDNNVHVHYAKEISPKAVVESGIDMFLFGGPLRAGNISFTMKSWANKLAALLKKQKKSIQKAAVWGSHAKNGPDTPPKFSWDSSKLKWKALLDTFPSEKKLSEVIGFDVNPATLEGPLEPGWEELVTEFANKVKSL